MKSDNYYGLGNVAEIKDIKWKYNHIKGLRHKKVLDIGCGDGRYLKLSKNWYGIDNDDRSKVLNDKRNFKSGDILTIPYDDDFFYGIILSHVIEHVPREKTMDAIKEMKRVLKPGGKIFLYAPNPSSPFWYNAVDHVNPVNLACVAGLFQLNDFNIIKQGHSLFRILPNFAEKIVFTLFPYLPSEFYIVVESKKKFSINSVL